MCLVLLAGGRRRMADGIVVMTYCAVGTPTIGGNRIRDGSGGRNVICKRHATPDHGRRVFNPRGQVVVSEWVTDVQAPRMHEALSMRSRRNRPIRWPIDQSVGRSANFRRVYPCCPSSASFGSVCQNQLRRSIDARRTGLWQWLSRGDPRDIAHQRHGGIPSGMTGRTTWRSAVDQTSGTDDDSRGVSDPRGRGPGHPGPANGGSLTPHPPSPAPLGGDRRGE
jgi:hypothetical protein